MSNVSDTDSVMAVRQRIALLTDAALCGNWSENAGASVLQAMGRSEVRAKACDIPAAMEMVSLLQLYSQTANVTCVDSIGEFGDDDVDLVPGIVTTGNKLLLKLDVPAGDLEYIAHWISDALPSAELKAMPGILVIPFTIEVIENPNEEPQSALFPDWMSVFYPHGNEDHAFPILVLKSVLTSDSFLNDWVNLAVARLSVYGLPRKKAESFISKGVGEI